AHGTSRAMHQFDPARQQFVNAVAHDGVGLAAADLHQHPGLGCRLDDLRRQGPCDAMVTVFVKILHKLTKQLKPSELCQWRAGRSRPATAGAWRECGRAYASAGGSSASSAPISSRSL